MFAAAVTMWLARQAGQALRSTWATIWRGTTGVRWNAILITLALMLLLWGAARALCGYYHILGTDKVGQDVFYLSLKSIRTGLVIGTLTTLMMLPFAFSGLPPAISRMGGRVINTFTPRSAQFPVFCSLRPQC
jgi:peptide/nickel transport system permease protein